MRKSKKAEYLKLLKAKRLEIARMDNELNTKRKMLNLEIDMILEILGMSEDEVKSLDDSSLGESDP